MKNYTLKIYLKHFSLLMESNQKYKNANDTNLTQIKMEVFATHLENTFNLKWQPAKSVQAASSTSRTNGVSEII